MVRSHCACAAGKWVVRKDNEYLVGDRLTERGIQPAFDEDVTKAHVYFDQDRAEMAAYRCGGKLESLSVAQAV